MPNGAGMTKDERTAYSIAKQFLAAVERLENFSADPDMIYEDMRSVIHSASSKVQGTMEDLRRALLKPQPVVVLMLNDFPIGVYSSETAADKAAERDWKTREPRWEAQGLKLGQSIGWSSGLVDKYHYNQHVFSMDEDA